MPTSRRPSEVSAGGVVVRSGDAGWDVCLIRVGQRWSLPKGNLDPGETPQQAALREVSEETGLPLDRLAVRGDLAPSEYAYRRAGRLIFKLVHHFLIEAPPDAPLLPQTSEVEEARWVPFEEALQTISYRDLVHPLEDARRLLGGAPR
jgi:8-oxo-dGTP pyrophosphatase MutT (NUDIX family)